MIFDSRGAAVMLMYSRSVKPGEAEGGGPLRKKTPRELRGDRRAIYAGASCRRSWGYSVTYSMVMLVMVMYLALSALNDTKAVDKD